MREEGDQGRIRRLLLLVVVVVMVLGIVVDLLFSDDNVDGIKLRGGFEAGCGILICGI